MSSTALSLPPREENVKAPYQFMARDCVLRTCSPQITELSADRMLRLAQPEDCPSQGRLPPRHRRQQVRHDTDVNSALQNL